MLEEGCNPPSITRRDGPIVCLGGTTVAGSWTRVADVNEIPQGEGRVFDVAGRALAVFNVDGQFYALDNACTHRGGPLGEGELDGAVVTCPWHAWRWDVTSGANVNNPGLSVPRFAVEVRDGAVLVNLA
jgi:nitrite reductase (NADH) small subunit